MYEPLDGFEPPTDHTVKVWRYLDFTKFVALLDSRALFFTRADQFLDPFEGALPHTNIADWPDDSNTSPDTNALARLGAMRQRLLRQVGIASWHMNEHESAAMWSLYLKSDEGVAIQTTYQRLTDAFRECDDPIHLGVVQYIDFDHETIPWAATSSSPSSTNAKASSSSANCAPSSGDRRTTVRHPSTKTTAPPPQSTSNNSSNASTSPPPPHTGSPPSSAPSSTAIKSTSPSNNRNSANRRSSDRQPRLLALRRTAAAQ